MRVLGLLILVAPAWGCSCDTPALPCVAAGRSAAVFTGTVLAITENSLAPVAPLNPQTAAPAVMLANRANRSGSDARRPLPRYLQAVRMQVAEVLSGVPAGAKEITIMTGGSTCAFTFQKGVAYIVYAYRNSEGQLETNICSRTRELSVAAQDLEYLRRNANAPDTGSIRVTTGTFDNPGPAKQKITLEREGSRYTAETGPNGAAEFSCVPAGDYVVRDETGTNEDDPKVRLYAKGCAEVALRRGLRISGRVTSSDGVPVAGIGIQAQSTEGLLEGGAVTDPQGNYDLRVHRPGKYRVGINLTQSATRESPYPTWFHPGTSDAGSASTVAFSGKAEYRTLDLVVPPIQPTRVIEGIVLKADGQPVPIVRLIALDESNTPIAEESADATGRFRLTVFTGTPYRLHAVWPGNTPDDALSAIPARITPSEEPLNLRLTLSERGNSYLDELNKSRKPAGPIAR